MALWWRRKVDFLRSYLLVSFGQVINNLTSLTFFKRLANEFLVTVLEYEQIFFFLSDALKKVHDIHVWTWKELKKLKEFGQGVVYKWPKPDHALFFLCKKNLIFFF